MAGDGGDEEFLPHAEQVDVGDGANSSGAGHSAQESDLAEGLAGTEPADFDASLSDGQCSRSDDVELFTGSTFEDDGLPGSEPSRLCGAGDAAHRHRGQGGEDRE